jgi:hypothetical protein
LDGESLDAYLRFSGRQTAQGSCKVQDTQRRRAPRAVWIEAHRMKGAVRRQEQIWSNLRCKSSSLSRFDEIRVDAGRRQGFRTSVKFEAPVGSRTVASMACRAKSLRVLSRPRTSTSKSAGLSVLYGTSARVSWFG